MSPTDDCSNDAETALLAAAAEEYDDEDDEDEEDYYTVSYWWTWPSSNLLKLCTQLENNQQTHVDLSHAPHIGSLDVSSMKILANALRRNHSLQSFRGNMSLDQCSNDAAMILWKAIARHSRTLEILGIASSSTHISAVNEFVECFVQLKLLSEIDLPVSLLEQLNIEAREKFQRAVVCSVSLRSVHLTIGDSSKHDYSWFGQSLSGCQSLRKLSVTGYSYDFPSEFLPESVRELTLQGLTIGEAAVKDIGKLIPQLESFSLDNCSIPQLEQETLLNFTLTSKSLNLHTFHWSHIGDVGAIMISRLLQQTNNPNLKVVQIGGLSSKGAIFLADAVSKNTVLEVLDLKYSQIGRSALDAFGRAVKTNSTLRELLVLNRKLVEVANGFVAGLEKNGTLVKVTNDEWWANRPNRLHSSEDLREHIDFLLLCNRNQNWEIKNTQIQLWHGRASDCSSPSHAQATKVDCIPADATANILRACHQCSVSNIAEKEMLQCSQRLHDVCKTCVEVCFESRLGESHMSCPIAGCTSNPWTVESDFYGFVSQFHYKMHCKEAYQQHTLRELKERVDKLEQKQ